MTRGERARAECVRGHFAATVLIALIGLLGPGSPSALAHDGGFGHSRRTFFLAVDDAGLTIEYRVKQSDDEALVEMTHIDQDGDGSISPEEKDRYFNARARELADRLTLTTPSGQRLAVRCVGYTLDQALVQLYRFSVITNQNELLLVDGNFPHKPGLVSIETGPGVEAEPARAIDLTHADQVSLKIRLTKP